MKKYLIGIVSSILLIASFTVARAQTSAPYSAEPAPPVPAVTTPPVTAVPPVTQAVEPAPTTQQSRTQQSAGTNPSSTQTYTELNLPPPELPVINLETSTQETAAVTQAQPVNIDTQEIAGSIIGPVMDNQLKIVLVIFLGAISGAILSLLLLFLIKVIGRRSR